MRRPERPSRRRGAARIDSGLAVGTVLADVDAGGTFTRASSATYLTDADSIASALTDVRRQEDRGDGNGAYLLLEQSRTNVCLRSEALDNASWTSSGTPTVTPDIEVAPDGATTAERIVHSASAASRRQQSIALTDNTFYAFSHWALDGATLKSFRLAILKKDNTATLTSDLTAGATWGRHEVIADVLSGGTTPQVRVQNATDGLLNEYAAWGFQMEALAAVRAPSSYIPTAGASVTRAADLLAFSGVDAHLATKSSSIKVLPRFTNAEAVSNVVVLSVDGTANNCIQYNATDDKFEAVQGGSVKVASNALTWARHALLTISWNPTAGSITVSGAATGNGTVVGTGWTWTLGTVYVGSANGTLHCPARYGDLLVAA